LHQRGLPEIEAGTGSDGVDVLPVFTGAFCAVAQAWMLPPMVVRLPARRPALARNGQAALT